MTNSMILCRLDYFLVKPYKDETYSVEYMRKIQYAIETKKENKSPRSRFFGDCIIVQLFTIHFFFCLASFDCVKLSTL